MKIYNYGEAGKQGKRTHFTFNGYTVDGIHFFGMKREKWLAIRDARLDLILKRYGFRLPSVKSLSRTFV